MILISVFHFLIAVQKKYFGTGFDKSIDPTYNTGKYFCILPPSKMVIYQQNQRHFSIESKTQQRPTHTNTSTLQYANIFVTSFHSHRHLDALQSRLFCANISVASIQLEKNQYADFLSKHILPRIFKEKNILVQDFFLN